MYILHITYSWGDEEQPIPFEELELAWTHVLQLAIAEAECTGYEHECEIGLSFAKKPTNDYERQLCLHYTYDDTYCFYSIKKEEKIHPQKIEKWKKTLLFADNVASEVLQQSGEELNAAEINYLLEWSGDDEFVTLKNGQYKNN